MPDSNSTPEKNENPSPNNPGPNSPYVSRLYCEQRTGQILTEIRDLKEDFDAHHKDLSRIKDSLYGIERAGTVEGGLVGMVGEIIKNQKKAQSGLRWFAEKLLAPILVAVIIALIVKGT